MVALNLGPILSFALACTLLTPQVVTAQENVACLALQTQQAQDNCAVLYGYIEKYVDEEVAADYNFYIEDMVLQSYPELRVTDAMTILEMFEDDEHLVQSQADGKSRRIVVTILAWMGTEQTAGGAGIMETAIARLHRIAPETTKRAIRYAATLSLESLERSLFTPWDRAVNVLDDYEVSIRGLGLRYAEPYRALGE